MKSPLPTLPWIACALATLWLLPNAATATSFVMVADETLADQAPVIAEVRVLEVDDSAGSLRPATVYRMAVEHLIAGYAPASPIDVRIPGGLLPDGTGLRIYGAPRFEVGGRALLFLKSRDDGSYGILHLMLGAFYLLDADGRQVAVRDLSETLEVALPGRDTVARGPRDLERFRDWLADRKSGVARAADYFVADAELGDRLEKYTFIRSDSGRAIRWQVFDTGGSVSWRAHESGQPGVAGGGFSQFQTAIAAWNADPDTPIRYNYAGTTTATGGLTDFDSVNAILFDDPNSEFDETYNCATGGVLAHGGPWFRGRHTRNGTSYETTVGADITTNKNAGCYLGRDRNAEEVFAHELGHTLGLGHSCGDDDQPPCTAEQNAALMRAFAHGGSFGGAKLGTDDRAGIRELYGTPLAPPAAPSNLVAAALSGNRVRLTWTDNSTEESSFDVERRVGNGPFQQITSRSANSTSYEDQTAASGTTYGYRVRARNPAGISAYSNTASVTTPGEATPSKLTAASLSSSRIRLDWQDNSTGEGGFEIQGKTPGGNFSLFQTVGANVNTATLDNLTAATFYTFRVRAVGGTGSSSYSNEASATTFAPNPEPCVAGPTTLCLNDGRFKVEVNWRTPQGVEGPASDVGLPSNDSGLLWFFGDDNWEMLIKVLDACDLRGFENFWVFAAATTDVEYRLTVTDSFTGLQKVYDNDQGVAAPAITDTAAFTTCTAEPPPSARTPEADAARLEVERSAAAGTKQGKCEATDNRLCLNDDRFAVEIEWRDFLGQTGPAMVDPFQSADSGLFYFFDEQNLEMLIKVLDGCAHNDRFWVYAAATTDVEYTLTVTDTETGARQTYVNPLGNAADTINDTNAFEACDP